MGTKDILNILKKFYGYFTIWVLTLNVFYHLGALQNYYQEILFLHIFVSMVTLYLVYINPKKFAIDIGIFNYTFEGSNLIIIDLLFHHLPLFLLFNKGGITQKKNPWVLLLPLFYKLLNDTKERYLIDDLVPIIIYTGLLVYYLFSSF